MKSRFAQSFIWQTDKIKQQKGLTLKHKDVKMILWGGYSSLAKTELKHAEKCEMDMHPSISWCQIPMAGKRSTDRYQSCLLYQLANEIYLPTKRLARAT